MKAFSRDTEVEKVGRNSSASSAHTSSLHATCLFLRDTRFCRYACWIVSFEFNWTHLQWRQPPLCRVVPFKQEDLFWLLVADSASIPETWEHLSDMQMGSNP